MDTECANVQNEQVTPKLKPASRAMQAMQLVKKKEKITGIHKEKDKITRICVNKHKNHQAGSYIQNKIIKRNRTNIMPVLVTGYSRLG